jgi:predicted nucleic acid-binding protein
MFVDTNILVKSRIQEAPDHDAARTALDRAFRDAEPLRISRQILREYLAVVTRPQTWVVGITREEALADVERLVGVFEMLEDGPVVTDRLLRLCREVSVGGRQIHDANIVATMLAYGERRLLTFNTVDFRRYGNRIELLSGY